MTGTSSPKNVCDGKITGDDEGGVRGSDTASSVAGDAAGQWCISVTAVTGTSRPENVCDGKITGDNNGGVASEVANRSAPSGELSSADNTVANESVVCELADCKLTVPRFLPDPWPAYDDSPFPRGCTAP